MELSDATEKNPETPGIDPGNFRIVATPGPSHVGIVFILSNGD
jgi:hypothetical protein